jgi:hypothetical protein
LSEPLDEGGEALRSRAELCELLTRDPLLASLSRAVLGDLVDASDLVAVHLVRAALVPHGPHGPHG